MEYKYNAIVLSKIDIAETDRIYTVYTREEGKMRMVAKGVRRPNAKLAGNLEPLSYTEIFLARGRGRGKIIGAISAEGFLFLKCDIDALQKVFFALKIFAQLLTQEEKDEQIFDLLLEYMREMDKLSAKNEVVEKGDILTQGFIFKLLFLLGYGLETKKCLECFSVLHSNNNFFSAARGGVMCGKCAARESRKIKITDGAIKLVRIFMQNKLENLGKLQVQKKDADNLRIVLSETLRWTVN